MNAPGLLSRSLLKNVNDDAAPSYSTGGAVDLKALLSKNKGNE